MLKFTPDEFINEVREEIMCYEELGEQCANEWEENFRKRGSRLIKEKDGKKTVVIKDETDIFKIVDEYMAAVVMDETDKYFESM